MDSGRDGRDALTLRLVVADFAGHPFQCELSAELARREIDVTHTDCASLVTPQADFGAAVNVKVRPVELRRQFEKYSLLRRLLDELTYGVKTARVVLSADATHVVTSNMPLLSLAVVWIVCRLRRIRWVLWLQDLQSGLASVALGRPAVVAHVLGWLERSLIRRADAVVVISPEFERAVLGFGADASRVHVIENWAPLKQLPERPVENDWSIEMGLSNAFVFLYSGSLGKKHSAQLLVDLADEFIDDPDVRIVVVAEGAGVATLESSSRHNLDVLPFQPFGRLADVMGTASVLVALLEPSAGGFSVPSKVLSYLCAGRPILASIPIENAAARMIDERASAGIVVSVESAAFRAAARTLYTDADLRERLGVAGRAFAEATFDRVAIGDRFLAIIEGR